MPPALPSPTELALLPSGPLAPESLTVPVASVPCWTLRLPLKVFDPESDSVPAPIFVRLPAPSIAPPSVRVVPPVATSKAPVPPVARVNFLVLPAVLPV